MGADVGDEGRVAGAVPDRTQPRGRWRPTRAWVLGTLAFLALGGAAVLVEGLPGHRVPFFVGDLAFHLATAHTMAQGSLNGAGVYAGIPSYYGGAFPLVLALAEHADGDSGTLLMIVSWAEPLLWAASAWVLGRALWTTRVGSALFVAFVLFGAGVGLGPSDRSVDAPNLAGQVFWPIFPRDIAFMLLMLTVAAGLRGRWLTGGVLAAVALSVQAQIGMVGLGCLLLALLVGEQGRWRWRLAAAAASVALIGSVWWWLPRLVWAREYGVVLANSRTRIDLVPSVSTLWHAFGLVGLLAVVGAVGWFVKQVPTEHVLFRRLWAGSALLLVVLAALAPGALISFRRALVVAALPVAVAAVDAVVTLAPRLRFRWLGVTVAAVLVVAVVGSSVPVLRATRQQVSQLWGKSHYAMVAYDENDWHHVWTDVGRSGGGPLLSDPSDAAMVWFRTGRPVAYAQRPGYLKLGFDARRATGWSEDDRRREVTSAFLHGPTALCALARRRHLSRLVLRSMRGRLGVVDVSGGVVAESGMVPSGQVIDRNSDVVVAVPAHGSVDLSRLPLSRLDGLVVWQAAGVPQATFSLIVGGHRVRPRRLHNDGATRRDMFRLTHRDPRVRLVNRTSQDLWLVRILGLSRPTTARATAPAVVVPTRSFCG